MSNHPESLLLARLAEQNVLVDALLTDALAPGERVEAWSWARAFVGPRSWSELLPYMVAGYWLRVFRRVLALPWRRLRAAAGVDPLVYDPVPYVLMVLTDRRLLATRFEAGRTLLDQPGGVRAIGQTWSATCADEVRCSRSFGQWVLELDGAPGSAVVVPKGPVLTVDSTERRGAALMLALQHRGWLTVA